MSRMSQKFHRIGLVLAVPFLVAAMGIATWGSLSILFPRCGGALSGLIPGHDGCRQNPATAGRLEDKSNPDLSLPSDSGISDLSNTYRGNAPAPYLLILAWMSALAAGLLYAATRVIGWVVEGGGSE